MIQGKVKRKIYFTCGAVGSMINKIVPKKKNKIVFFSTTNLYDNSEALFQHLIENEYNGSYEIVCAVRNCEDYQHLNYKNVKFIKTYHSIFHILTCKYLFYHNEMLAIRPTKKQKWVDFWHATTFKKINKMIDPEYHYDYFTYITATSEAFRPIFAEAFGCELERVIINGHPRNDYLFDNRNELHKLNVKKEEYHKIIMWMPTYRISFNEVLHDTDKEFIGETGIPIFLQRKQLEEFNEYLKREKVLLYIKVHPAQKREGFILEDMSHIKYLFNDAIEEKGIRFYSLLKQMDAIVTDYSSVFFDYLLLNRPIGFTIEDLESYGKNRGFVFENPLDYMPGAKISSVEQFYEFVNDLLMGNDKYEKERLEINEFANYYKDNRSCQRILDYVGLKKDGK